jgi:hypothetical protein
MPRELPSSMPKSTFSEVKHITVFLLPIVSISKAVGPEALLSEKLKLVPSLH